MLQSSRDLDERDSAIRIQPLGRKPSVAKLTLSGLSYVASVMFLYYSYTCIFLIYFIVLIFQFMLTENS